jgi:DNA gyrase/topoisomerase IV subunit B
MALILNGDGSIQSLVAGGLPTGTVTQATLATPVAGTGPAFYAYNSSATALSAGTSTKITFDTEVFDTNSNFASSRFTSNVAGYYQVNAKIRIDYTNGTVSANIYKNGSVYSEGNFLTPTATQQGSVVSTIVYMNGTTDYLEVYAFVGSAGNTTTGQAFTYFNGALVRAA